MTFKQRFKMFMKLYEAKHGCKVKCVETSIPPIWINKPDRAFNRYTVYFKRDDMPADHALLVGCGKTYETAYKNLYTYYVNYLYAGELSDDELKLKYSIITGKLK